MRTGIITNQEGYWLEPNIQDEPHLYRCLDESACLIGGCDNSTTGVICGECAEGYARWNDQCVGKTTDLFLFC